MRVGCKRVFRLGTSGLPLLGIFVSWVACSANTTESRTSGGDFDGNATGMGGSASGFPGKGSGGATVPPETEKESSYELPVQSGRWVWSANPISGRVAAIDTRTREIALSRAGSGPTYLAALPAEGSVKSAAIVLNVRSDDASLMRLGDDGISVVTLPTHPDANAWAVSASGRFALAWSDATRVANSDAVESFQDVTVIDTVGALAVAKRLSVGYRPSRIFYQSDEGRAFVVSQSGISVIELGQGEPFVSRDIGLSRTATETPIDVAVVPTGTHALFRVEGSDAVSFVELVGGQRVDVTLSGPVTDLDLVANGSSVMAVVRARTVLPQAQGGGGGTGSAGEIATSGAGGASGADGASEAGAGGTGGSSDSPGDPPTDQPRLALSEVAVLQLPEILEDPSAYERAMLEDPVGSVAVSEAGNRAVLYTTALPLDRVTLVSMDASGRFDLAARRVRVRAPVEAVFVAPDAAHAIVALKPLPGGTLSGFGVLSLIDELPATIKTAAAPITGVAFAQAPSTSAILTAGAARTAYVVRLPERQVQNLTLSNLPLAAGIMAEENLGYVAQRHPDGQLTLVELDSGEQRTLTGFELAGGVIDGD